MTTIELKTEIKRELKRVPEDALQEVLDFLKELHQRHAEEIQLDNFLEQTLIEDKELLEKLAQ
jgi:mRNA-degrading endonuclease RelE of RelBE toxin-antitoxin system